MKEKHFTKWTRKEFEALPRADYDNHEVGVITDFIILPKRTMHDSGYRNMEFVVLKHGVPTYIIGGCSDVVLLGGIGGVTVGLLKQIGMYDNPDIRWNIDCLPVSGLLHIWCNYRLIAGGNYSTMEVFVTNEDVDKVDVIHTGKGLVTQETFGQKFEYIPCLLEPPYIELMDFNEFKKIWSRGLEGFKPTLRFKECEFKRFEHLVDDAIKRDYDITSENGEVKLTPKKK